MSTLHNLPTPAHRDDPETSKDIRAVKSPKRTSERVRLLRVFLRAARGGMGLTSDEAGTLAHVNGDYDARRHCSDMKKAGLLEDTDQRRPSNRGNPSAVKVITDKGRAALIEAERKS